MILILAPGVRQYIRSVVQVNGSTGERRTS